MKVVLTRFFINTASSIEYPCNLLQAQAMHSCVDDLLTTTHKNTVDILVNACRRVLNLTQKRPIDFSAVSRFQSYFDSLNKVVQSLSVEFLKALPEKATESYNIEDRAKIATQSFMYQIKALMNLSIALTHVAHVKSDQFLMLGKSLKDLVTMYQQTPPPKLHENQMLHRPF